MCPCAWHVPSTARMVSRMDNQDAGPGSSRSASIAAVPFGRELPGSNSLRPQLPDGSITIERTSRPKVKKLSSIAIRFDIVVLEQLASLDLRPVRMKPMLYGFWCVFVPKLIVVEFGALPHDCAGDIAPTDQRVWRCAALADGRQPDRSPHRAGNKPRTGHIARHSQWKHR